MRAVWKFERTRGQRRQVWLMPAGAQILHCEEGTIWALVDAEHEMVDRTFTVVGTDEPLPDTPAGHIGTWRDGPFVWHLLEL